MPPLTFVLVDLASQARAVMELLEGQSQSDILQWLRQHGTVQHGDHPYDKDLYVFISYVGMRIVFRLTEAGDLWLVGDHTVYGP